MAAVIAASAVVRAQLPSWDAIAPADFGMRLEFGRCTTDVLDTFQGVFMREMGGQDAIVTIPVSVPVEVLDAAWRALNDARFFDYPSHFHLTGNISVTPAAHYRLEVRSAGRQHLVAWGDRFRPSSEEADRLRAIFDALIAMVKGLPEIKQLPGPGIGCG